MTQEDPNKSIYDLLTKVGLPDGWDAQLQEENFAKVMNLARFCKVRTPHLKVLDVGCGTAKLYEVLVPKGIQYRGNDVYAPSLDAARKRVPGIDVQLEDILTSEVEPVDVSVASGSLSTVQDLEKPKANYEFLKRMVERMWGLSRRGVYFNFIPETEDVSATPEIFAYDPKKVLEMCKEIAGSDGLVRQGTFTEDKHQHIYMIRNP
jgi:SAM-dependent methyltransferase